MQPLPPLPAPSEAALLHSRAVAELVRGEIKTAGGWISFAHYMKLVLYAPGMGYYSAGAAKFGRVGDFVTAPEISPLFGRALAQQAAQVLELVDGADILEFGAGTGKLALDLLLELQTLGRLPGQYFILEVSSELKQRQKQLFEDIASHLLPRLVWLEHLPEQFNGLMLANEVLDAMPVHLVVWRGADLYERGITATRDEFRWVDRPLVEGVLFETAQEVGANIDASSGDRTEYISEIGLEARGFVVSLANVLQRGAIVLIDYGFGQGEYYHPQRRRGTMMCHYRHHAHDDPFYLPGLQDVTSHVDFSAIAEVGIDAGLELLGYTTQANFLINCGITEILARTPAGNAKDYLPRASELQKLVSPAEMGDLFKAIALGRGVSRPLIAFSRGDKSRML